MRLYGAIQKIEPQDDGTVRVYGIATSEAVDEQGEVVRADAIRAAIPDYMHFPALREMHQLSAAGSTLEAEVCEDGTTRIVAHVVDPVAVAKVRNRVYRGFSIGGRITQREPGNPKTITGLVLNEISLVDRPANPEAIFDCWKAAIPPDAPLGIAKPAVIKCGPADTVQAPSRLQPFNLPIQIWACTVPDHRHLAKADALKCLGSGAVLSEDIREGGVPRESMASDENAVSGAEYCKSLTEAGEVDIDVRPADPAHRRDARKPYPIGTDRHLRTDWSRINRPETANKYADKQLTRVREGIVAGRKEQIATESHPPAEDLDEVCRASLTKATPDVGQIARVIAGLDWLRGALELEEAVENDQSPQPARLQAIITELCDFLSCLANEEIGESPGDAETDGSPPALAMPGTLTSTDASDLERIAAFLGKGRSNMRQLAGGTIAKAKHSRGDQALLDTAHFACDRCLKFDGLSLDERADMDQARDYLQKAGAMPAPPWTAERTENDPLPASLECPAGNSAEVDIVKVLGVVTKVLSKRERAHQNLMDVAHGCLQMLTDGHVCEHATKVGARHSMEIMQLFKASHRHLVAAGARCDAAIIDKPRPPAQLASQTNKRVADLANAVSDEPVEKAALAKVLGEVIPMIERLTERVDAIARTPLPPLTMAKGTIPVSKQQDRGSNGGSSDPELSPEAIAAALGRMSKEEQTLTLIKASYATPIRIAGSAADQP